MNRRDAIGRVALIMGGAVIGAEFFISGCKPAATTTQVSDLFDADHVAFLNEVADTILPTTSSPGAKAANVGGFMAVMVQDCYTPEQQRTFMAGIQKIDDASQKKVNKKFLDCDAKERTALLTELDKAHKQESKATPKPGTQYQYFSMIKQLTLLGYFTSEAGATKALRYVLVPGRYDGDLPYKKGDKAWALS